MEKPRDPEESGIGHTEEAVSDGDDVLDTSRILFLENFYSLDRIMHAAACNDDCGACKISLRECVKDSREMLSSISFILKEFFAGMIGIREISIPDPEKMDTRLYT